MACGRNVAVSILAAALKHQNSKLILRSSTIIFTMKIMVEVLNICNLLHRDSNKAEPVSLCCPNKFPLREPIFRKYLNETDRNDVEEALKRLDSLTQEEARMARAGVKGHGYCKDDACVGPGLG